VWEKSIGWCFAVYCGIINCVQSKTILRAGALGAVGMAYAAMLIFRFDIFSVYTLFFVLVGAGAGILIAYKIRFR
jgi:hypothetical protein